jgi:hypothetical protein
MTTPADDAAWCGWWRSRLPRGPWRQLATGPTLDAAVAALLRAMPTAGDTCVLKAGHHPADLPEHRRQRR